MDDATYRELESCYRALDFVRNRMDSVAEDIIGWMPPEDNDKHHNAVECLQRGFEVVGAIQSKIARLLDIESWHESHRSMEHFRLESDLTDLGAHDLG